MTSFVHIVCLTCLISRTCAQQSYWPQMSLGRFFSGFNTWMQPESPPSSENCFQCTFLQKKCPEGFNFALKDGSTICHIHPCKCISDENEEADVIEKEVEEEQVKQGPSWKIKTNYKIKKGKHSPETDSSGCDGKNNCFGGDMLVAASTQAYVESQKNPFIARNFNTNEYFKWPLDPIANKYIIPYSIADATLAPAIDTIDKAIAEINEAIPCVLIKKRTTETDYIKMIDGNGCYSYIGRIGGPQQLSISMERHCDRKGTIQHEFMHAMGFFHEHTRADRDEYVTINYGNIVENGKKNFDIYKGQTFEQTYDYESVLHYSERSFSISPMDKLTIVAKKDPSMQKVMGQREGLSNGDIRKLKAAYKCAGQTSGGASETDPDKQTLTIATCKDDRNTKRCIKLKDKGRCGKKRVYTKCKMTCNVCETNTSSDSSIKKPKVKFQKKSNCNDLGRCKQFQEDRTKCQSFYPRTFCKKACGLCN